MLKTCVYVIGTLALHYTDFSHPDALFSRVLPLVDAAFIIFLLWQLLFFFSLHSFSDGDTYHFSDLLVDIYDLRYDIADVGIVVALVRLSFNLIEMGCFFLSIFYCYSAVIDMLVA